jgi:hypothetical protein
VPSCQEKVQEVQWVQWVQKVGSIFHLLATFFYKKLRVLASSRLRVKKKSSKGWKYFPFISIFVNKIFIP